MPRKTLKPDHEIRIDEEVSKLSEEELQRHFDGQNKDEDQAKFDALIKARDDAQQAVSEHTYRNFAINTRLHALLRQKRTA